MTTISTGMEEGDMGHGGAVRAIGATAIRHVPRLPVVAIEGLDLPAEMHIARAGVDFDLWSPSYLTLMAGRA